MTAFSHVWIAGQLCGVDGYMESTAMGLVAAADSAAVLRNRTPVDWTDRTMIGLLVDYVTTAREDFQPVNANYGLLPIEPSGKQKPVNREVFANAALDETRRIAAKLDSWNEET
jgi:methylenetetrahydrofolate--tRNA-(uracil-5-)-methyltransferase